MRMKSDPRAHPVCRTATLTFTICLAVSAHTLVAAAGDAQPASAKVRVATLVPFVADALARVPEHASVVASVRRSSVDDPPPGAIDLGSPHAPSLERLAESRAQLVVADRAMHAAMTEKLARGGA